MGPAADSPYSDADVLWMRRALALAERGRGRVEPNPAVGCVLVDPKLGQVVGEGWHGHYRGPHAEVEALEDARRNGRDPAGATAYVTLEPCSHQGKTPPCADALVRAKVGRVVAAMRDPHPQVSGRGLDRLREAGIEVVVGVCEAEAARSHAGFVKRITRGLPLVTLKWAATADGRTAARTGDSKWITGASARRAVHELRGRVDAVMTGVGTVLADDPALTAREVEVRRVARRVVVDPNLRTPMSAKVLRPCREPEALRPVFACREILFSGEQEKVKRFTETGAEVVGLPETASGRLALEPLLKRLVEDGASHVLVEGGAGLAGSLAEQGLVDRVLAFVAPRLLVDGEAVPALGGTTAVSAIAEALRLSLFDVCRYPRDDGGVDVMLAYDVVR